ncbi:MAG: glycosyltransferase family 4 protein [Deltaproteobacteria bacterium]|nr:glycosyltransferase family 4 protein [Deltaproteobacteria bacterium]
MRIGLIVETLEAYGGLEEIVTTLAIALQGRGHQTAVLSTVQVPPENQYRQLLQESGVPFVQWPLSPPLSVLPLLQAGAAALLKQQSWSRASWRTHHGRDLKPNEPEWFEASKRYERWTRLLLAPWHRYWRPDLLHLHCYTHEASLLTFLLDWTRAKRLTTLFQEHQTPDPISDFWDEFRRDINKATCVAAVSQESARILCEELDVNRPIFVVPPIVAVPTPPLGRKTAAIKAKGNSLVITAIARLIPVKGLSFLLEAMAQVRRTHPDIQLRIYGDGPLRQHLVRYATDLGLDGKRIFAGTFRRRKLAEIMMGTDIFVLASVLEGLPLSLIEAMAYSRPIVATAVGGIPEIIKDGKTGLFCPPGDPACLAEKLQTLIEDPAKRAQLGQAARIAYEKGPFYPDAVCDRFEFVYRGVLALAGPAQAQD